MWDFIYKLYTFFTLLFSHFLYCGNYPYFLSCLWYFVSFLFECWFEEDSVAHLTPIAGLVKDRNNLNFFQIFFLPLLGNHLCTLVSLWWCFQSLPILLAFSLLFRATWHNNPPPKIEKFYIFLKIFLPFSVFHCIFFPSLCFLF